MRRLVGKRLSYANVVATLALFVALGGSSYAALKVTGGNVVNSSLTGRDVRNNSLGGVDIRNGSLLTRDFGNGQLPPGPQGPQGPQGVLGPQGPPGAPATRLFAVVSANAFILHESGVKSGPATGKLGTGAYSVAFNRDVGSCAPVATVGPDSGFMGTYPIAFAGVHNHGGSITIRTTQGDGTPVDAGFNVAVFC